MDLPEFEQQYRDAVDKILSDLQTITLRLSELERQALVVGNSVKELTVLVENFIESQKK